ncbi:flagellum-associated coiled-coil domain-containing protein 1-like, partial [Terrapene carolina triunguis]|uniref:flagellum-associated coiled-coil domain-containing protein 1-like n=1 Tax=Terrapene triunguis TaxID=2587831 RepID=UPI000E776847
GEADGGCTVHWARERGAHFIQVNVSVFYPIKSLEADLKEKEQILKALTTTMQNAQVELKKEKSNLMALEKNIQQKISAVELKHQLNITSLADENAILRRKLITKSEEAFNERVRRKSQV